MKRILSILSAAVLMSLSSVMAGAQTPSSVQRNASSLLVDAVQDYESENYQNAVARLTAIEALDPENDAAFYFLGLCYHFLGQDDEAEKAVRQLAENCTDGKVRRDATLWLAKYLYNRREWKESGKFFESSLL